MTSFTPLEDTSKLDELTKSTAHAGKNPVGVVIDRSCRVYITNIPDSLLEKYGAKALKAECESFGTVESYQMFTERSGRFIGSALCTYRSPADAAAGIKNLNGLVIDGATISAAVAKDHGVLLLHSNQPSKGFLPRSDKEEGERWSHDKFEMIQEGKDMDEVIGYKFRSEKEFSPYGRGRGNFRGRGRGRGGRGPAIPYGERVNSQFEQYIAERDEELNKKYGATEDPTHTNVENNGEQGKNDTVKGENPEQTS